VLRTRSLLEPLRQACRDFLLASIRKASPQILPHHSNPSLEEIQGSAEAEGGKGVIHLALFYSGSSGQLYEDSHGI
jgi:hypothetical protein